MYRGPFRAAIALLQLLVFLGVQFAEGTGVHRCPEHDAGVGIAAEGGHAMHDMAAMGHEGHGSGPDQPAHMVCRCMGACATTTVAMPGPTTPVLAYRAIPRLPAGLQPVVSHRDSIRLLPFAIGPPLLA